MVEYLGVILLMGLLVLFLFGVLGIFERNERHLFEDRRELNLFPCKTIPKKV
jgi:hypothetical protein